MSAGFTQKSRGSFDEVPEHVFDKLVKLAKIPTDRRSVFGIYLSRMFNLANPEAKPSALSDIGRAELLRRAYDTSHLEELGRATVRFSDALQICILHPMSSAVNRALCEIHTTLKMYPIWTVEQYQHQLTPLIELAFVVRDRGEPERKSRDVLRDIVVSLLRAVEDCGGVLRFSSADEGSGTLIDALEALRPVLPSGAVPRKLPMSTLQRIRREYRRGSPV